MPERFLVTVSYVNSHNIPHTDASEARAYLRTTLPADRENVEKINNNEYHIKCAPMFSGRRSNECHKIVRIEVN